MKSVPPACSEVGLHYFARRTFALLGLCAALGFVATSAQAQQQDFSKVEIKATKVSGSVYMLEGSGGNIGVSVGEDGIVIVDDQFAPLAPKIKAALHNITDKPLKYVINTHFHFDHTGGNREFGKEATIMAHENVRLRLEKESNVGGNRVEASSKEALPVVTFSERASLHLNGEEIRALHLPNGHTDGDSVIYFTKSNVLHMGDDFVTYGFPFVDVGSGGSVTGLIDGLESILAQVPADAKVIPGHGQLSTTADVRKFIGMLKETRALVAAGAQKGKTADELKKENVLAKFADLGKGFIKTDGWIDLLFAEVTHRPSPTAYENHGHRDEKAPAAR